MSSSCAKVRTSEYLDVDSVKMSSIVSAGIVSCNQTNWNLLWVTALGIDKENRLPHPIHKDSLLVVAIGKMDSAKQHLVLRAFADKLWTKNEVIRYFLYSSVAKRYGPPQSVGQWPSYSYFQRKSSALRTGSKNEITNECIVWLTQLAKTLN